ncbi:outer membrane beta-barrel protein [Pseudoalteromonas sp. SSM20]|uniref:outer membrane beta-barrel protein n=1 Tax=Pseudoalteromonas sp. SSM20 TaxID=3139394 RepID=UPI003BA9B527
MKRFILFSAVMLSLTTNATAQQNNNYSYVALGIGGVSSNDDVLGDMIYSVDLAAAYHFNKNWGVEAGYKRGLGIDDKICNEKNSSVCLKWERNISALTLAPQYSIYSTQEFWRMNLKAGIAQVMTDYQYLDTSHTSLYLEMDNEFKVYDSIRVGFSVGTFDGKNLADDNFANIFTALRVTYQF